VSASEWVLFVGAVVIVVAGLLAYVRWARKWTVPDRDAEAKQAQSRLWSKDSSGGGTA
jgi:hypothetical protein